MAVNRIKMFQPVREAIPPTDWAASPTDELDDPGKMKRWADNHPALYLAAAVLLGATIAWFIKRQ